MKNKLTITIGIPAYNEAKNIKNLLSSIAKQELIYGKIEKIIIYSDASTDNMEDVVKNIHNPKIALKVGKKRIGANLSKNEIIKITNTDILIFLNADMILEKVNSLDNLIYPILNDSKIVYTSGLVKPVKPRTLFEKMIYDSHYLKISLGENIKKGNNIYMSYGGIQAISKKLYKKLSYPVDAPEDAYLYFYCKKQHLLFRYVKSASILFRLPSTFTDHKNQSTRFESGKKSLYKYFGRSTVTRAYFIPKSIFYKTFFEFFVKNPIAISVYLFLTAYLRFISKRLVFSSKWKMAASSKEVTYE